MTDWFKIKLEEFPPPRGAVELHRDWLEEGPLPGQSLNQPLIIVQHAEQPAWAVADEDGGGEG